MVGETRAYALIKRYAQSVYSAAAVAFDPTTLAVMGTSGVENAPDLRLQFALSEGGMFVAGATQETALGGPVLAGWQDGPAVWMGAEVEAAGIDGAHVAGNLQRQRVFGREYGTAEEAAVEVLQELNPVSIFEDLEVGGRICRVSASVYVLTRPRWGDQESVAPRVCREGTTRAARWHTHGRGIFLEDFSEVDKANALSEHVDGYLGTPCGSIRKYSYVTGLPEALPFRTGSVVAPLREECGWQP